MKSAVAWAPALATSLFSLFATTIGAEEMGATAVTDSPIVIPLRLRDHFPIIVAKVDGVEVSLVLDTGDESTVALHQTVLNQIKAEPTGESTKQQFAEGPIVNSQKFRIRRLELGQALFADVIGRVDIHDPSYQATDVGQKGFLGTGLLKPYKVVIDYKDGRMILISSQIGGDSSNQCRGIAVPFAASKAPNEPVADVNSDWGHFSAWWDTGSPASMVTKRFIEAVQPTAGKDSATTRRLVLGGSNFGPWRFDVVDAHLPPWFDGLLGYDFFATHIVCIDFPRKRVVVVR